MQQRKITKGLSPLGNEIMEFFWKVGRPANSTEVREYLNAEGFDYADRTVLNAMLTLEERDFIEDVGSVRMKHGRARLFRPTIGKHDFAEAQLAQHMEKMNTTPVARFMNALANLSTKKSDPKFLNEVEMWVEEYKKKLGEEGDKK